MGGLIDTALSRVFWYVKCRQNLKKEFFSEILILYSFHGLHGGESDSLATITPL